MTGWFILNIQSDLFWHRCLERQTFGTPRMYTLSLSKSIKRSNYGEFLKVKNVLFMYLKAEGLYRAPDKLRICVFYAMKTSKNACIIRSVYIYAYILLCKQTFQIRVYMDYQKAFDTVPHKRLHVHNKLTSCGINEQLIAWIYSFLSECSKWE
jgi:hypothetical protein